MLDSRGYQLLRHRTEPLVHSLAVYRQAGGYDAWETVAHAWTPADLISEVDRAGLRGRGGAGFPTGRKWSFLPQDGRPRVLVVNGDEGEPGTFKDRELIEGNPHQLIEGTLLAAHAIGADISYVYLRGEFLHGYEVLVRALAEAEGAGLFAVDADRPRTIRLYRGAGAYICGEETALLESLEGKRGQPRYKPPFPAVSGLYGLPTVVNNVETLVNLPLIIRERADGYRRWGTTDSPGLKVVSISGQVNRPGNVEVPMGTPLQELIQAAGGVRSGHQLKAVIPGGSSMPILGPEHLATPYDFGSVHRAGSQLGSGGIIVLDDSVCMVQAAARVVRFYRDESCGKCTPCREGTFWNTEILNRIEAGAGTETDLDTLMDTADNINEASLCPLGPASTGFMVSVLQRFRSEFVQHVRGGGCPRRQTPQPVPAPV